MSQLPLTDEPRSAEEWVSHLAEILLKEERIVSNERPFQLSADLALDWFNDNYAHQLKTELLAASWSEVNQAELDDEEPDVAYMDSSLTLYKTSTENMILTLCADCPDSDIVEQLSKWGPAQ